MKKGRGYFSFRPKELSSTCNKSSSYLSLDGGDRSSIKNQIANLQFLIRIIQLIGFCFCSYLPTKVNRRIKALNNEIHSLLKGIIGKRQKAMDKGGSNINPVNDLLGILMESNSSFSHDHHGDNNNPVGMSIDDVIEECELFYFAGSETTASLLVWTMVLLCMHPEWQTRARQEVVRVLGNSEPTFEDLNHLKTVRSYLFH